MKKRNYTHVQALLPAINAMLAEGKTQREVAEYYGFQDKQVVKRPLARERRKERKLGTGGGCFFRCFHCIFYSEFS